MSNDRRAEKKVHVRQFRNKRMYKQVTMICDWGPVNYLNKKFMEQVTEGRM